MYRAPIDDIRHALFDIAGMREFLERDLAPQLTEDLVDAILSEAGRFAAEEIAPVARIGDEVGAKVEDGVVTTPPGWRQVYAKWCEGGWNSVSAPEEYGGQGLPAMISMAVLEMWNSASMGFAIGPTLTIGAIDALEKHASEELKARYIEKMVSGEWMGTMNLTEPQAGSDLAALRARAEPRGDGTYRIFGQKIFITYGEQDFTDNIIHLVLARLPDAPPGTKGISLFLVPKFLVNEDGTLGARNDVFCASIEKKMGIHGSPTCTMIYGDGRFGDEPGAIGWLVGEPNRGLNCMFTMMNAARLAVGIQGVGVAEAARQKALEYAKDRKQGRVPGTHAGEMAPIVKHQDVRRMLLSMTVLTQASRAIAYACAHASDMARFDRERGAFWLERVNLLTPIAKAFPTDMGVDVASLGVQVHGGMGFIEETGAAVLLRDARIAPIYEGTNGIQAIDLVIRKLPLSGGEHVRGFLNELKQDAEAARASNQDDLGIAGARVLEALADTTEATEYLLGQLGAGKLDHALSAATPFLRLMALAAGGALLLRGAVASGDPARAKLAFYFADNHLSEVGALKRVVIEGSDSLIAAGDLLEAV
ncbi:acyl-CoA dehydrogenase [Nitratireductor aestuarii]|uniref:3-methylmercaptopropionyl-CoA dehydrogenase n=1 Tax=Nitratireductor aestuarii TaxID=1735103 RepID=A0A916RVQ8_9HYPH|nr:acyl-CoA dehydrogenase [Nitratireductor aestuarii]GGA72495.1 acyl-CoA dehydrogenase [Nitratireductor aestuarii]